MTIKRFTTFPKKNEVTILDEFLFLETLCSKNDYRFYIASEKLVFLFVEEQDVEWIKKLDVFSLKIDNSMRKTMLIPEIEGKVFVVFIKENDKEHYTFYGIYSLGSPYTSVGGAGLVIDVFSPLVFNLECKDFAK